MPQRPVCVDITRLLSRLSRPTPNGIDRVDLAYARRYLVDRPQGNFAAILLPGSPRALPAKDAAGLVEAIAEHWGETNEQRAAEQIEAVTQALAGPDTPTILRLPKSRPRGTRLWKLGMTLAMLRRSSPIAGALPKGCAYINVSQFPVWRAASFRWMDLRPDLRSIFFLHDVLPFDYPEFFPAREAAIHLGRLATISARAGAVIVASDAVANRARLAIATHNRPPIAIRPVPLFADAVFTSAQIEPRTLAWPRYFVACGTLEPRKNLPRLLQIWRALSERHGDACPRLLLLGGAGWNHDQAMDLLQRDLALRGKVVFIAGLSSLAVRDAMMGALALLMPSYAEGFGLPIAEAAALGLPIIASNRVPAVDELAISDAVRLDPIDGTGWLAAIQDQVERPRSRRSPVSAGNRAETYFGACDQIIDAVE